MIIKINTDSNIQGTAKLEAYLQESMQSALKHYIDKITRLDVHLSDQNGQKSGPDDIQCKIEAKPKGMSPVLVTAKSSTKEKAIREATDKMKAALESAFRK